MSTAPSFIAPTIAWRSDFADAVAASRKERKPVLIDVYQDDCSGCDKLDDVTFADAGVAEAIADRFVPLKLHLFQDRASRTPGARG